MSVIEAPSSRSEVKDRLGLLLDADLRLGQVVAGILVRLGRDGRDLLSGSSRGLRLSVALNAPS